MMTKEYIVLQGASSQSIVKGVLDALAKGASKVLFNKDKSYIVFQRPSEENEEIAGEGGEVYSFIRQREIIDISGGIVDMFLTLNERGLYPAYLLVKNKSDLSFLQDNIHTLSILFGAKIFENDELEDGIALLSGTSDRTFEPIDIKLSVKGYL